MVASLIIPNDKIQRECLQDEIFGESNSVVWWIQDSRPRHIVLVIWWMIDIGCRWRV